jgi:hydrogenase expression/formation protein HypD
MRYVDEYRDPDAVKRLADAIHATVHHPWTLMEICGGQTHAIVRFGLDERLPQQITLLHGPGCPVCVTPVEKIDRALAISRMPGVIFCSFGDMLRVPGTTGDLLQARAQGADVRVVYSPSDAVRIAQENPGRQVVFFAVGFETTAPANAMAIITAFRQEVPNFSMLVSHVLVPPAMEAILSSPRCRVQGFLAAGHVCSIMGTSEYLPIAQRYKIPVVVTGFEPIDLLHGIYMCVKQLEEGRFEVENAYIRAVKDEGNLPAQQMVAEVFQVTNRTWRGVGDIPASGLSLRPEFQQFDAEVRFDVGDTVAEEDPECRSGLVLQGLMNPTDCPVFGTRCTPEHPLGATMVSGEGACAAYYRYRRYAREAK